MYVSASVQEQKNPISKVSLRKNLVVPDYSQVYESRDFFHVQKENEADKYRSCEGREVTRLNELEPHLMMKLMSTGKEPKSPVTIIQV